MEQEIKIGIDGSNLRYGGGVTHLVEMLNAAVPSNHGINEIVLWGSRDLLEKLPEHSWLKKISPFELNQDAISRIWWQKVKFGKELRANNCDVLFASGGSINSDFRPVVTMSRNLLPFELTELGRFGLSFRALRLLLLRMFQTRSFKRADGLVFLTAYARLMVQQVTGPLDAKMTIIPHGVSDRFRKFPRIQRNISSYSEIDPYQIIYVSIINHYKHQWHVVEALQILRQEGYPIVLHLVGPSYPAAMARLQDVLDRLDPDNRWVKVHGSVQYECLPEIYAKTDLGIFASSCENMPNILLETMAAGLPTACSDRGPMTDILGEAGIYFDPEDPVKIAAAVRQYVQSPELRTKKARLGYERSLTYSWRECAAKTLNFLSEINRKSMRVSSDFVIGIDASRNRSGGAISHLVGILSESDPVRHGFDQIHLWSYQALLDKIPDQPWLVKHAPPELCKSIFRQFVWQRFGLFDELCRANCSVILNTDAGTVSNYRPSVTMSRDMLSYEPGEINRFGFSKARLRLVLLRWIQNHSLRNADGAIFLTRHASAVIQQSCGRLANVVCIPHGVGDDFKHSNVIRLWPIDNERSIDCYYVSNVAMYKHQWVVAHAIHFLRGKGFNITLTLIGDGQGRAQSILDKEILLLDPNNDFIFQNGHVQHCDLPLQLSAADIFIFASSCENMPNTLLEGMALGLPIACSDRGPMPEILSDGGVYFDPLNFKSIADAVEQIICNDELRKYISKKSKALSEQYSWKRCADETWQFVVETAEKTKAKMTNYQICTNCVMDTTDHDITFDAKGVCDHCNTFYKHTLPNWLAMSRNTNQLDALINSIKKSGEGKEFDCIIGMSGGIDSSYLTFLAKEQFGLRPLVFHVDAGWNSQVAVNNIEKLVDGLNLDLYTEVIDWEEMRDLQLSFFKSGVPHIDTPQDHAFFATMYKFAEQHGVKYILTGANLSTECVRNPISWMYYQSDSTQLYDIQRKFGTRPLVNFPTTSILRHKLFLPYIKRIKVEKLLNYVTYTKKDAIKLLIDRFGWQPYPQKHFESRFTKFYEGFWLPKKFGYDTRRVQYSSLILTKQMTRPDALAQLSRPPYDEQTAIQDFEYVATKLGISVSELEAYLHAPNMSHKDFRNKEWIYSLGASVMKLFSLEVGGKR